MIYELWLGDTKESGSINAQCFHHEKEKKKQTKIVVKVTKKMGKDTPKYLLHAAHE